jgi:hypothetical protein
MNWKALTVIANFLLISNIYSAEIEPDSIKQQGIELLKSFNTGTAINSAGIAKTMSDLIPNFQINLGDGDIENGQINKIGFVYSPTFERILDVGVTVNLEKPKLNPQFAEKNLISDDQASTLGNNLNLGDSIEVGLSLSYIGEMFGVRFGRTLGLYETTMNNIIDIAVIAANATEQNNILKLHKERTIPFSVMFKDCPEFAQAMQIAINNGAETIANFKGTIDKFQNDPILISEDTVTQNNCLANAVKIAEETTNIENELVVYLDNLNQKITDIGVYQLTSMVAQQPQFITSFNYKNNDDLAGSDEYSVSLNYEWSIGEGNVNDFDNILMGDQCKNPNVSQTAAVSCIEEIKKYLGGGVKGNSQFRGALSAKYMRTDDFDVTVLDPAFTFNSKQIDAWSISGSLFWQNYLSQNDTDPIVIESSLQLNNNNSDIMNDQKKASLSATKNIGGISWTAALVWADKPEFSFQPDSDDLTTKIGINYKF